ncbi:hypothetical protein BBO99_00005346 [Phytophthora kernoviae]|uniref:SET domain-containing protein n=2 Tax=Phytophthora kernoviae TaxID=325452 RepID=A0A3R7JYW9_9STRA|nr:hypothetical protein G195_005998 [Phytophthora kernoviae 00238/432]KAG2523576.1 hypothetical protein JM16_005195 [Phytophthora kernoviae]KAG2525570.1 hypothetical protein JM18_004820 [Phytophthora kernoviae]RLN46568.1 hypothetical protein BBI17_005419 [Phytophthora kernoviae]RLN79323.1 hypothetical protein BBO99_00005346 [Phytophthora kernoviae]
MADEEVVEYVLRLVVGHLGASEQVFHALKSELDFSQAYTAYCELKKLHDSREQAGARIAKVCKLIQDEGRTRDSDITALSNLMKHSSLSAASAKASSRRLQPPISTFESNIVDNFVDSAMVGMAALGLRATDSYNELVDVYRGSFCRMCYQYGCHEHGGEHSLPTRRVDPAYPRVQSAPVAALGGINGDEDNASDSLDGDTICLDSDASEEGVSSSEVSAAATRSACTRHKRLMKGFSGIHGYGMYAHETIAADEFVYEYTGAMLSQDEAERRGMLYDKMNMSYLFDLNEDAVLDALRSGNKSKFINHEGETPNCTAKVVSVCGIHHISIWALRNIAKGEELFFDYGYKGNVGPEWSKHRSRLETVAPKDTS